MAGKFTVKTDKWNERSYVQGLLIHKPTGTTLAIEADPGAGGETFEVHASTPDGRYLGRARVGNGHGSSVGIVATGNSTAELWWGDERQKATGWAPYQIGQTTPLRFVRAPALPQGDVSIDSEHDVLCVRNGNRFRGYRLSTAKNAVASKLFDFSIPGWGNRFQGHFVYNGALFVHRDLATKSTSKAHVFDYKGKLLQTIDTTKMGDEAEGFTEKDGTVYAVKRTGGTGPSRVIVATPLDVKLPPPASTPTPPKPPTPPKAERLRGVDVSSNNEDSWKPAAGDAFGFVKSTEGHTYTSPKAAKQLEAIRSAGKVAGHYHALWPGDAKLQAEYFVAQTDIRDGEPLWCDWEKWKKAPTLASIQDVAEFIAEVQRLRPTNKVGLYCSRSDWMSTSVKAGDGLWIAEYDVSKPDTATDWIFWQYSETPIDQNVSKFTSRADLDKWCKVNRSKTATPTTPGKVSAESVVRPFPVIPDYDKTERIPFRGGLVCRCLALTLPWIEYAMLEAGVIKYNIDFFQFGYRTDVKASANTHAGGGVVDIAQSSDKALRIAREFGLELQRRTKAQGFDPHAHGVLKGCPHLSGGPAGAAQQAKSWEAGRNGLRSNGSITGPEPKGDKTPRWDNALTAYLEKVGAPPINLT